MVIYLLWKNRQEAHPSYKCTRPPQFSARVPSGGAGPSSLVNTGLDKGTLEVIPARFPGPQPLDFWNWTAFLSLLLSSLGGPVWNRVLGTVSQRRKASLFKNITVEPEWTLTSLLSTQRYSKVKVFNVERPSSAFGKCNYQVASSQVNLNFFALEREVDYLREVRRDYLLMTLSKIKTENWVSWLGRGRETHTEWWHFFFFVYKGLKNPI